MSFHDKIIGAGGFKRRLNFIVRCVLLCHSEVFCNCSGKERVSLRNKRKGRTRPRRYRHFFAAAFKKQLSLALNKGKEKPQHRCFSGAGFSAQGNNFPRPGNEIRVFKNRLVFAVSKLYVFKRNCKSAIFVLLNEGFFLFAVFLLFRRKV